MSVTTTTAIASNVAAYSPVIYAGSTSRTPFVAGVRLSQTITAYSDASGKAKLTVSDNTGFELEDTIMITGATGDFIGYNGLHKVEYLGSGYITTEATYSAGSTGTKGTVYKWNDSLRIRLAITDGSDVLGSLYAYVNTDGTFSIDVSKALQGTFGSIFTQTPGDVTIGELFAKEYEIWVYESWQAYDYTTTEVQDSGETQQTVAHRTTVYDSDYVSGTSLLNGTTFAKSYALIHFMTDKTSNVHSITIAYTNGTGSVGVDHLVETYWLGHAAVVVAIPATCDYVTVSIGWDNGTQIDPIKDLLYIYNVKQCNSTVLYYLNRLGGYEGFAFTSYEDSQIVERVDKYKPKTWLERTLQGREYPNAVYQSVRDLITSPEVYDESAVLVEVLTDSMTYRAESVNPVVVVKYEETNIQ